MYETRCFFSNKYERRHNKDNKTKMVFKSFGDSLVVGGLLRKKMIRYKSETTNNCSKRLTEVKDKDWCLIYSLRLKDSKFDSKLNKNTV